MCLLRAPLGGATQALAKAAADSARASNEQTAMIAHTMSNLMEQQRQLLALAAPSGACVRVITDEGGVVADGSLVQPEAAVPAEVAEASDDVEMHRPQVRTRGSAVEAAACGESSIGVSSGRRATKKTKPADH